MKLLLAIVSNDDASSVISALNEKKFQTTKLATTGGFLSKGNTTVILGVEDNKVEEAISIIGEESKSRQEVIPNTQGFQSAEIMSVPVTVKVGGATIFVLNVDQFKKL